MSTRPYTKRTKAQKRTIVRKYRRAKQGLKKFVLEEFGVSYAHVRYWEAQLGLAA